MKSFFVIGNPIKHSFSPKLHSYWIKKNNLKATYKKKLIREQDIEGVIGEIKDNSVDGLNVTVPFKKLVIPFLDELTLTSNKTQSVNTIYKKDNRIIGDNTDVSGFEKAIKYINFDLKKKKAFIIGAGGVVPSIIFALKNLGLSKIYLTNRTKEKAESIKEIFSDIEILNWGELTNFDIIINATSIGLNNKEIISLNFNNLKNKIFYDLIYNPTQTNFLLEAKKKGNFVENGKMMFLFQAQLAFKIWHNIIPKVDNEIIRLLDQ